MRGRLRACRRPSCACSPFPLAIPITLSIRSALAGCKLACFGMPAEGHAPRRGQGSVRQARRALPAPRPATGFVEGLRAPLYAFAGAHGRGDAYPARRMPASIPACRAGRGSARGRTGPSPSPARAHSTVPTAPSVAGSVPVPSRRPFPRGPSEPAVRGKRPASRRAGRSLIRIRGS